MNLLTNDKYIKGKVVTVYYQDETTIEFCVATWYGDDESRIITYHDCLIDKPNEYVNNVLTKGCYVVLRGGDLSKMITDNEGNKFNYRIMKVLDVVITAKAKNEIQESARFI